MNLVKDIVATTVFSLLLPLSLLAKDNSNTHSIKTQIYQSATVAGTALEPGQYKVEWTGTGPAVNAEFTGMKSSQLPTPKVDGTGWQKSTLPNKSTISQRLLLYSELGKAKGSRYYMAGSMIYAPVI